MAFVITIAQQKGGAGKTTVAANLAAAFAATRRAAVLDIDPQHSLARWHALRAVRVGVPQVGFSDVSGWRLAREIDRLKDLNDILIVDSPPQLDTDAKLAIRAADLVLVPLQPSPPDFWAAEGTLKLAAAERRPARILLNRAPASGKLRTAVEAAIAEAGYPVLVATIGNRVGFAVAFAQGLGIGETAPRSTAGREFATVVAEIEELIR